MTIPPLTAAVVDTAARPVSTVAPRTVTAFASEKFRFFSFVAMLLLVYVHGYNLNERYLQPVSMVNEPMTVNTFTQYLLANGLFRFRIPILFIISGFLFALHDRQPFGARIQKRVRTLLVPYVLWSAIGLAFTYLLELTVTGRAAVSAAQLSPFGDVPVAQYTAQQYWDRLIMMPASFQLWFLRCLFFLNLAYPLLVRALRWPRATFTFALLFWMSNMNLWFVESEGLLFFTLGIWLARTDFDIDTKPRWLPMWPAAAVWVVLASLKTWMAFQGNWDWAPYLLVLYKLVVAGGMLVMWYGIDPLVRVAMRQRWFAWITGFSFMIYALHVPLLNYALAWIFPLVRTVPNYRLLTFVLLPLAVAAFCVAVGALLRRVTPRTYALLTGGRGLAA
jgi:fucose 4-O-acetylase-like acetyltransferase